MRSNLFGNIRLAVLCTRPASHQQVERRPPPRGRRTQTDEGFRLVFIFACASVVLGISGYLSARLLPYDGGLLIYSMVASGATIVLVWILVLRSTPSFEAFALLIFSTVWLTMGAMAVDRIGWIQCFDLSGNLNTGHDNTMDAGQHCRHMKAIEAFSWALFVVFISMFLLVLALTIRARSHGAGSAVWRNSISELPWFGQWMDGNQNHYYYNTYPQYSMGHPNAMGMVPQSMAPNVMPLSPPGTIVIPQQPGHSVRLQRDPSGNLTNIIQTPVH